MSCGPTVVRTPPAQTNFRHHVGCNHPIVRNHADSSGVRRSQSLIVHNHVDKFSGVSQAVTPTVSARVDDFRCRVKCDLQLVTHAGIIPGAT